MVVKSTIKDFKKLQKRIEKIADAPEKAAKATISDFKSRAPGWVASEVIKTYNIKKAEIKPNGSKKSTGGVVAKGETLAGISLEYVGQRLTPVHFSMGPTEPKPAYTLKATSYKGQRKTLGKIKKLTKKQRENIGRNKGKRGTKNSPKSPIMLMHTGAKNEDEDKVKYIPFQRESQNRNDLKAIKTLSMPQTVSNPKVAERINEKISTEMGKRLQNNINRFMK